MRTNLAFAAVLSFLALGAGIASYTPKRVEINLEAARAPLSGFDDNDQVQVVIHGSLPNACYTLADTEIESREDDDGKITFSLRQFALKQVDGICANEAEMPKHMRMKVPFTSEVFLGKLEAGDYAYEIQLPGDRVETRELKVEIARAVTVDSLQYAKVTAISMEDVYSAEKEIEFTIEGVLNSSCVELDYVELIDQGDVFVILPVTRVIDDVVCAQILIPFKHKLDVGTRSPGHYLIHSRSQNGQAVNRMVEVMK